MTRGLVFSFAMLLTVVGHPTRADMFGSGDDSFEIEFVRIGNAGNPPDDAPNPAGAVGDEFRMGKYEVSERMIDVANLLGGLGITHDGRGPNKPATSISWFGEKKGSELFIDGGWGVMLRCGSCPVPCVRSTTV